MKKSFIITTLVFIFTSILLTACQTQPVATTSNTLKVVAAESFLADIAANVAGDRATVDSLIPLEMDPHAFEPVPSDVAKIADSPVIIINGGGIEGWLEKVIENTGGEHLIIDASSGLKSREAREGEEAEMSPGEHADQICGSLEGKLVDETITAGDTLEKAAALHDEDEKAAPSEDHDHPVEIVTVKLNGSDDKFSGFIKVHVEEDGDILVTSGKGTVTILNKDGREQEIEDTLTVDCQGLSQAVIAELEPGIYTIQLSDFAGESTLFSAGAAAGHHHHESDPHFWLDPVSVIHYVENIRDGLIKADPEGKDTYTKNADAYIGKLKDLDASLREQAQSIPAEKRLIVTNHESFGYFADRYDFTIIGTIIPSVSSGASPSAQQLARLVDHIKATGATAIFLEAGTNPQLAEQVAKETGIKVVTDLYTHSITAPDGKAPTYIDMMKYNMSRVTENLK